MEIKKSSIWRNRTFSAKKTAPMLKYLNDMSKNGLHLNKIGRLSCTFTEDAGIRYVYSIGSEQDEMLYTEKSGWEHFCNYKGVPFYRKSVPSDAVKVTRFFKKKQIRQEERWLNTRLGEGLVLIANIENEYIFERTLDKKDFEYSIRFKQKKKPKTDSDEEYQPLGDITGYIFVCASQSGAYYLIKNEAAKHTVKENRGKRLSNLLLCALAVSISMLGFFAFVATALFGLIKGGGFKTPMLIIGGVGALVCAVLFGIYYNKFGKISEARRIKREEKRRAKKEAAQSQSAEKQEPIEEPTNNTVVMNTVVMNNYGAGANQTAPFNPQITENGQMIDSPTQNPGAFVQSVLNEMNHPQVADTIIQGEPEQSDIWQPNAFKASSLEANENEAVVINLPCEEPVICDDTVDEEKDNQDDEKELDSFPLGRFLGLALICFASILAAALGIRYCISWFSALGQGDPLLISLSVIGIGFAPFAFKFGFTGCKKTLYTHNQDEE